MRGHWRMQSIMTELTLQENYRARIIEIIRQHAPNAEIWAYGSRVSGKCHEGSDVDLVLRDARQPERATASITAIRGALEESTIPLVVDLHDWAMLPEDFQENVRETGILLSAASPPL